MKIFDSHDKAKRLSEGVTFVGKNMIFSSKSKLSVKVPKFRGATMKIVARKVSGNGIITLRVKRASGEIAFQKELKFTSKSWSEASELNMSGEEGCLLELVRHDRAFGRVEVGRINLSCASASAAPEAVEKVDVSELSEMRQYARASSFKRRVAIIVPYKVYGGAEVYIESILSNYNENFNIDMLYMFENVLKLKLADHKVSHKRVRGTSQLTAILSLGHYDTVVFYNSKNIYSAVSTLRCCGKISAEIIEIYHSDFIWPDAVALTRTRQGVDKIIRVSAKLAEDITGVPSDKKVTIPVGIDTDRFVRRESNSHRSSKETVFGIVARLSPEKNISYAIRLISEIPEARLVIVGTGPQRARLDALIKSDNIKNVTFVGYQDETEDYYNTFDAFLLTSKMEGTPISILEAMSCGLPVYSTGVGQISNEFSHLENFHILNGNIETDVEILRSQIDSPNYYQNLREFILDNHNIKNISSEFYESIADNLPIFEPHNKEAVVLFGEYI